MMYARGRFATDGYKVFFLGTVITDPQEWSGFADYEACLARTIAD